MTPQETVFMIDLIKKNYRRRMFWFILNVFVWLVSMSFTIFAIMDNKMPAGIQFLALLTTAIIAAPSLVRNADSVNLPWDIKKRQAKAIKEFENADFEEIRCSVPLKEYFEL